jgi:diguanylate cyclase (GGDEF)-like protein
MLTYAIGFVQDVQLTCFAIVFVLMAINDRCNRSLRWLACAYLAGFGGAVFDWAGRWLTEWIPLTFGILAAPIGYSCLHAGMVEFVRRGARTRWISAVMLAVTLPLLMLWSAPGGSHVPEFGRMTTLADFFLAVQTAFSAWLLLSTRDPETVWPRRLMGIFLCFYSAVEFARVAVYLVTGKAPDPLYHWVEVVSGIVYVVSCSILPFAFIWMMNARLHAHMARQLTTDPLTELLNRRGLQTAAEVELARYLGYGHDFAVVLADIDYFKRLNDLYGHASGDAVLRETAALFRSILRESDIAGRLGGEEFVLILPETSIESAMTLVENIRSSMERQTFSIGEGVRVTSSFGVTGSAGRGGLTWSALLSEADLALYAAKRAGRNLAQLHLHGPAAPAIHESIYEATLGTA